VSFHILLALADEPLHGYAVMRAVADATDGRMKLGSGTLYRAIASLLSSGLVKEASPDRPSYDDARRRYYEMTAFGRTVLVAETKRMAGAVTLAKAKRLLAKPG
jgi:DNA-binding PadR family transcriptional regulator